MLRKTTSRMPRMGYHTGASWGELCITRSFSLTVTSSRAANSGVAIQSSGLLRFARKDRQNLTPSHLRKGLPRGGWYNFEEFLIFWSKIIIFSIY